MQTDMWKLRGQNRLLALISGITLPLCMIWVFKFTFLATLLLCAVLAVSFLVLKSATGAGRHQSQPATVRPKVRGQDGSPLAQRKSHSSDSASFASPARPTYQMSPLKRADNQTSLRTLNSIGSFSPNSRPSFVASPPKPMVGIVPKPFTDVRLHGNNIAYALPVFSSPEKSLRQYLPVSPGAGLNRSPISSVRPSAFSPTKTTSSSTAKPSSQYPHRMVTRVHQPLTADHSRPAVFPLPSRHYPTHQPDYARTSLGILPSGALFSGEGSPSSSSPSRLGSGRLRTHSPVTVKIARPDHRRSASPLFRRLSLERASGSPLHKDAVLAALSEKRKRVTAEEQEDGSSLASSTLEMEGFSAMKRRRLDDGSRCSTPSVSSSAAASWHRAVGSPSASPANGSAEKREALAASGGLLSKTPRNPITSSVSSSRRAAQANQSLRKRVLLRPATPECSPTKKPLPVDEDSARLPSPQSHPATPSRGGAAPSSQGEGEKSRHPEEGGAGESASPQRATPSKAQGRNLLAAHLKTPRLKTAAHQLMKNGSPPKEYTAADLKEDRHREEQLVGHILGCLRDVEEEEEKGNGGKPSQEAKGGQQAASSAAAAVMPTLSAGQATTSAASSLAPASAALLQLSKMKTLPVAALLKEGQLGPGPKADGRDEAGSKKPSSQGTSAPTAVGTQSTAATLGAPPKGASSVAGFLGLAATSRAAPTPPLAAGAATLDLSKGGGFAPPSLAEGTGKGNAGIAAAAASLKKDGALLKGLLAGMEEPTRGISAAGVVSGIPTSAGVTSSKAPGAMMAGQAGQGLLASLARASSGLAPSSGVASSGVVSSAPTLGGALGGPLGQGAPTAVGFGLAGGPPKPPASVANPAASAAATLLANAAAGSSFLFQAPTAGVATGTSLPKTSGAQSSAVVASQGKPAAQTAVQTSLFGSVQPSMAAPPAYQFAASSQAPRTVPATSVLGGGGAAPAGSIVMGGIGQSTVPPSSGQTSTTFQFAGIPSSAPAAKTAAPTLSFGANSSALQMQQGTAAPSTVVPAGGLLNATSAAASGSIFGGLSSAATNTTTIGAASAAKPNFSSPFGLAASSQAPAPSFNFGTQPSAGTGATGSVGDKFQFKPAFGAQPQQQQQQQPAAQGLAAASGGFAGGAAPTSIFGTPAVAGSPFQTTAPASRTSGGIFGQQPTTQPPSFATAAAAAQPASAFGSTLAGQSMFGAQTAAPATTSAAAGGGFNFGAQSQANPSAFSFGAQPSSQPASTGSIFQFGQQPSAAQPASQPMGTFNTPTKPSPFAFGAAGGGSGFGTPAPAFGAATPAANPSAGFSLGMSAAPSQKRTNRMARQARQARRR